MILKECYDAFGGDYESVKLRITKDEMLKKFVLKFLSEPSYQNLCEALDGGNYEDAFRAAHSLKGVSANLGFARLEKSSSEMTELLRKSGEKQIDSDMTKQLLETVTGDYNAVIEAIRKLD